MGNYFNYPTEPTEPIDLTELENFKFENNIFGSQDKDNKKQNINKFYIDYVSNAKFVETTEPSSLIIDKRYKQIIYTLFKTGLEDKHCFFKNLRLKNQEDLDKIESFVIECGGQKFDKIYTWTFPQLQSFYKMTETEIPFSYFKYGAVYTKYHDVKIYITLKKDIQEDIPLLVDVYENLNENKDTLLQLLSYQAPCLHISNHKKNETELNINHPCYFFVCNKKLDNIILQFNREFKKEFKLVQEQNGIIRLTNTLNSDDFSNYCVNFSRIYYATLKYNCLDDEGLMLCAVNSQIIRVASGMAGLAYSK